MLLKVLLVAVAGGLGALSRWGLAAVAGRWGGAGAGFPWGTATVNVVGCLLFGMIWAALNRRMEVRPEVQLILLTGFMGAFTTFSTYAFETVALWRDGAHGIAMASFLAQNALGILAILLGMVVGRAL